MKFIRVTGTKGDVMALSSHKIDAIEEHPDDRTMAVIYHDIGGKHAQTIVKESVEEVMNKLR